MEQDGYCKETSKNARTEQLVSKLSTACWRPTTFGCAKELVKQGLSERNGMIAKDTRAIRQDCWSGEALRRVSGPVDIPDSQVNMTSLGDDARETLTTAGVDKAKERALEQHYVPHRPGQCCVQVWISTCERWWTRAVRPRQWRMVP